MTNKAWLAMGCGVGLRSKHYPFILSDWPAMDWFEAVTENFMDTGGRPLETLRSIRKHYPVALHGVSLSIASCDALNLDYLNKLKMLAKDIEPFVISDHLCWTGVDGHNLHDLLPLPLTEEALEHVVLRIQKVQEILNRPILIENISTYVTFKHSAVPEWEFLREVARRSGCGILLDLNNIYVNSVNHRFDPMHYLEEIPGKWVGQFHLAGHTDKGAFLFDTHNGEVVENVWALYRRALELYGPVSTLVEWDEAIPDFSRLSVEVEKAKKVYSAARQIFPSKTDEMAKKEISFSSGGAERRLASLYDVQRQIKKRIQSHNVSGFQDAMLNPQGGSSGEERMAVYADGYLARAMEALTDVYEAVRHLLGEEAFAELSEQYIDAHPSVSYNLNFFGKHLPNFIVHTSYAEKLPFLPDLAKLEWQIAEAFHASQDSKFDPASIASYSDDDWEKMRIFFQPSVRLVLSEWPIKDIWEARKKPPGETEIDLENRAQNVLVSRRGLEVFCETINSSQVELIRMLLDGQTLGDTCARLAEKPSAEELSLGKWFSEWAANGLIAKLTT